MPIPRISKYVGIVPPLKNMVIIKITVKNFLPTRYFFDNTYAARVQTATDKSAVNNDVRKETPIDLIKISFIVNRNL